MSPNRRPCKRPADKFLCDTSEKYGHTKIIDLNCGRNLSGYFVHITVSASSATFFMICNIVLNKDDGTVHSLDKVMTN